MRKTLLLSSILLLSTGIFADNVEVDEIYYELNTTNHTATVTKGKAYSGDIVIPESITYNSRPFNVTSIGEYAFDGCSGLTSITIPKTVTSMGYDAFRKCTGLTKVNITDLEAWCKINYEEFSTTPLSYAHHLYLNGNEITTLVIPSSLTSIGGKAFSECTGLTSVTIPNSVTSIGEKAFSGCTGLTSFTIPSSVTMIGDGAFSRCTGLTSITIPNSVTSIGENAFSSCSGLTSVTIPNSVTSISNSTFRDCTGLTSIIIPNSVTSIEYIAFNGCSGLTSITIPHSVTNIGAWAFTGCTALTSITVPDSVTSIGEETFKGCISLTSVTIGNSVTSIGDRAFGGCTGLKSVTIGNSVTSTRNTAFDGCINIETVISLNPTPPSCIFPSEVYFGTLYVPVGSESAYRNADSWKNFYEINEGIPDDINTTYTLAVSASKGGSVSFLDKTVSNGSASVDVEPDTEVTLSIAPDEGYRFVSLVVNGNDVTEDVVDGTYTIKEINEATSAVATFEDMSVRRAKMDNNGDGEVNSADVVNIYNYIITGE